MNKRSDPCDSRRDSNENEDVARSTFLGSGGSSSSDSSIPANLNLIDGEIEIIQRNKTLTEDDKLFPGTALHKINVAERDRKLLMKCSSVRTDWALELESSFLKGRHLLLRKVMPGCQFSHCFDSQNAFDVVVIRAHLMAKSGKMDYDGYFRRRQCLFHPLENSKAFKNLEAARRRHPTFSHFTKLNYPRAPSVAAMENQKAGGDIFKFPIHRPDDANSSEGIRGLLSASGSNEPIQRGGEQERFNGESNVKGLYSEASSVRKSTTTDDEFPADGIIRGKPSVDLPDPKNVPRAVIDVQGFDDVLANKKVINYLNRLEEGAGLVFNRLENKVKVSEEDVSSLNSATTALLREYGYNFPERSRAKKRSDADTTSESDVSDSELKSEVVKRAINGEDFSELMDLLKNSKEWKESAKDDWTSGNGLSGKIERKIHKINK